MQLNVAGRLTGRLSRSIFTTIVPCKDTQVIGGAFKVQTVMPWLVKCPELASASQFSKCIVLVRNREHHPCCHYRVSSGPQKTHACHSGHNCWQRIIYSYLASLEPDGCFFVKNCRAVICFQWPSTEIAPCILAGLCSMQGAFCGMELPPAVLLKYSDDIQSSIACLLP